MSKTAHEIFFTDNVPRRLPADLALFEPILECLTCAWQSYQIGSDFELFRSLNELLK